MNDFPIALETKDLIGILLIVLGSAGMTGALLLLPRLRSVALFLLAAGTVATDMFDLNIYSAYWYRGTTRGFEFTALDVIAIGLLLSSLILPRPGAPRWVRPASMGLMFVFIAYCLVTTVMATPVIFGLYEVSKLLRGVVYFLAIAQFVRRDSDLAVLALGLASAVCFETMLVVRERFLLSEYRPAGTLDHANSLSMYLCLVTPVLVAAACSNFTGWIRTACWAGVAGGTISILLTLSRAGMPIFAVCVGGALAWCASWRPTPGKAVMAFIAAIAVTGAVIKAWPRLAERYGQATLEEEYFDAQGESRGYYFRQAGVLLDHKPMGVGLNNWSYWVSREYGEPLGMHYENYDNIVYAPPTETLYEIRFAAPAHNLGVLTVGELGWAGLALLLILWARWLTMGASFLFSRRPEAMHRLGIGIAFGILGTFMQSFTEWTFRQTQIFFTFNLLTGTLAALYALKQAEKSAATAAEFEPLPEDLAWEPAGAPAQFQASDN